MQFLALLQNVLLMKGCWIAVKNKTLLVGLPLTAVEVCNEKPEI
jgi:hypothetical protein